MYVEFLFPIDQCCYIIPHHIRAMRFFFLIIDQLPYDLADMQLFSIFISYYTLWAIVCFLYLHFIYAIKYIIHHNYKFLRSSICYYKWAEHYFDKHMRRMRSFMTLYIFISFIVPSIQSTSSHNSGQCSAIYSCI